MQRRSRLFSAIVVAGAALGSGCRSRPLDAPPDQQAPVPDLAVAATADFAGQPLDLAPTGDLNGCFICPSGPICPSPCPPSDPGCWPCYI